MPTVSGALALKESERFVLYPKKTFRKVSHINMESKKAIVQMPKVMDGHHVDRNPEVEKEVETRKLAVCGALT